MDDNPYQPSALDAAPRRTRATRWLLWSAAMLLLTAAVYFSLAVIVTTRAVRLDTSSTSTPTPADLATAVYAAGLLMEGTARACVLFAVGGMVLLIAGVMIRRPVDRRARGSAPGGFAVRDKSARSSNHG